MVRIMRHAVGTSAPVISPTLEVRRLSSWLHSKGEFSSLQLQKFIGPENPEKPLERPGTGPRAGGRREKPPIPRRPPFVFPPPGISITLLSRGPGLPA